MKLSVFLFAALFGALPAFAQFTNRLPTNIDPDAARRIRDAIQQPSDNGFYQPGDAIEYFVHRTINCPAPFRVEIATPLPQGWEPGFQSIHYASRNEASVEEVRGYGQRLMCAYSRELQHYVHMAPPSDMPQCTAGDPLSAVAAEVDFVCRPAGDYVNAQGTVTVNPSYRVSVSNGGQNDFWWVADSPTQQSLRGEGGEALFVPISTNPDRAFCARITSSGAGYAALDNNQLTPGARFCYRAPNGRLGWFQVVSRPGRAPTGLEMRYTTWSNIRE